VIRARAWPSSDDALGGRTRMQLSDAAWVSVSLLLAELYERIERTGVKGELLVEQCHNKEKYEKVEYLSESAKDALYYVCGDKRKAMSFMDWLRKRRERHEKRDMAKSTHS